jgi:FlaA1/EpsC-like NDP-sugar epimerase
VIELKRTAQERLLGRRVDAILTTTDSSGFTGRRVLITGGGGSVGSELARQVAGCQPAQLVLFDHAEYNLFRIESELREMFPGLPLTVCLGDVSRPVDILAACREAQPHIVFHAAAYKHVTLAERSVVAAARTNVLGTVQTLKAARTVGARFVFISSDKAAEARSVMGATKRFAELVTLDVSTPRFPTMVTRFGNILGSSGSVVEIMLRCVERGRPVPVTDPEATRFFMTGEEAASLVMKAAQIGEGGEVFWLDMGDPVRIGDLVDRLITYATPKGAPRVPIETIGLRPGEKVREELTNQGLEMKRTAHHRIWRARQHDVARLEVYRALRRLTRACATGDTAGALDAIRLAVSDYVPSDAVLELAGDGVRGDRLQAAQGRLQPAPTTVVAGEPSR